MRILLIEDDEVLQGVLVQSLTSQHYIVDTVLDGQTGWEYAQSTSYDLILMDVGLPILDGIKVCHKLRTSGCPTPVLLITARDANLDRIRGLDAGADDYLVKPLNLEELQARIRALLRRGEVSPTTVLQVGNLRLDPRSCEVSYGEKLLALTPKEYTLLEVFLRNPSRVFSRGQLVDQLWTFDDPPLEESVKAHIKGLRQKLKKVGAVDWIENVYGLGYRLREGVGEDEGDKGIMKQGSNLSPAPSICVEQQFQQGISKLWQQFRGLMVERLEALHSCATEIKAGNLTDPARQSAKQAAHKLAGVLGMFEREAGTILARNIEQILGSHQALQPAQEQKFLDLVRELDEMLDLGESEPSSPSESRLLLIDPDPILGQELQKLAPSLDLSWKQVATLKLAETWLQSRSPDLVVLNVDITGQQSDCFALLSKLAARTPPIPVLLITSASGLLDRVMATRAGAQGFLVKPVTAERVWDTATQILQRNHSSRVNILVVDDDPVFLAALRPMLEPWGIRMTGLDDPLRFWEALRSTAPNLLILDVDMPQINGIELCQAVRTDPDWQGLPILFLTARCDRETIQQVFTSGADDYISKPVVAVELLTRITNRLERIRLIENLSTKDPVTGLANQPQSSYDLQRICKPFCLVVFNIIDLRQVNIQYGHAIGNQVLHKWGRLFQNTFRGNEILGYWGNGEFVVGMPGLTKQEASDCLGEILITLRQQVFTAPDNSRFQVTFSFGIAEYPTDGLTLQSLYQFTTKSKL
ncbi:multi-component transcriptional regulator [Calothrix sp. HK-06]|nr:multi-component transcriptional regulator [Calothrix sp. HK-06]